MDSRIDETERINGGYLMVHLKRGYCLNDAGTHTFGADNIAEIKATMKRVKPCHCAECSET